MRAPTRCLSGGTKDLTFRTAFVIAGGSADAEDAAQEGS